MYHSVMVLTMQHFFSLSPSLKIFFFLKPKNFFFSSSQTRRANTETISRHVLQIFFLLQSMSFLSNPKVSGGVFFVLNGTFEWCFT